MFNFLLFIPKLIRLDDEYLTLLTSRKFLTDEALIPKPIPFLTVFKNRLTNHPILIMGALACVSGIALLLTKKALTPRSTTEIEEQQQKLFLFAQE